MVPDILVIYNYFTVTTSGEVMPNLGSELSVLNFDSSSLGLDGLLIYVKTFEDNSSGLGGLFDFRSLKLFTNSFDLLNNFVVVVQDFHEVRVPFRVCISRDPSG